MGYYAPKIVIVYSPFNVKFRDKNLQDGQNLKYVILDNDTVYTSFGIKPVVWGLVD